MLAHLTLVAGHAISDHARNVGGAGVLVLVVVALTCLAIAARGNGNGPYDGPRAA
ncbi:hypothetical protein [Pseudolysinimonas sp.]|uniref:hypothetical protein n=1 Tax=Pseudolysinimonas sp. TaxID=2680009 RepID=UPI003F7E8C15